MNGVADEIAEFGEHVAQVLAGLLGDDLVGVYFVGSVALGGYVPVESDVVEDTESAFALNMVGCRFAEYFRSIGEPEIGGLITCSADFAIQAALRPDWEFRRTQTLMNGAPHCDFRWRLRKKPRS